MAFSPELIAAISKEAAAQGLTGATNITVALREQLVETRQGGRDHRTKEYWVAGRVVDRGIAYPMPGALKVDGLEQLSGVANSAATYALDGKLDFGVNLDPACAKTQIGAARVSLTRKGEAHVNVLLPHSKRPPDVPDAWVDLWVFRTQAHASAHAATLKAGKVF